MRYESIGILRGLAATLVVIHHVFLFLETRSGFGTKASFDLGAFGVDLFFIISGFVMVVSASKETGTYAAAEFLTRRAIRIVPLYWVATLILAAAFFCMPQLFNGFSTNAETVAKSLLFYPVYDEAGKLRPVISQGWTLYFEWYFYLMLAAMIVLGVRRRIWGAAIFMSAIFICDSLVTPDIKQSVQGSWLVFEFLMGSALGQAGPSLKRIPPHWYLLGAAIGIAILLSCGTPSAMGFDRLAIWGFPSLLIAAAFLRYEPVVAQAGGQLPKFLGEASYSIYLFHGLSFSVTWKALMFVAPSAPAALNCLMLCFGGILAGMAAHVLLERPMLKLLRGGIDKIFVRRNAHV